MTGASTSIHPHTTTCVLHPSAYNTTCGGRSNFFFHLPIRAAVVVCRFVAHDIPSSSGAMHKLYGYVDDSCACPYDMSRNGATLGGHTPRRCLQTSASSMFYTRPWIPHSFAGITGCSGSTSRGSMILMSSARYHSLGSWTSSARAYHVFVCLFQHQSKNTFVNVS